MGGFGHVPGRFFIIADHINEGAAAGDRVSAEALRQRVIGKATDKNLSVRNEQIKPQYHDSFTELEKPCEKLGQNVPEMNDDEKPSEFEKLPPWWKAVETAPG